MPGTPRASPAGSHPAVADLLLACAGTVVDAGRGDAVRAALARGVAWDALLPLARRHGLLPILRHGLAAAGDRGVPGPVLGRLRAEVREIGVRSLAMTAELVRLLDALRAHGVPALTYKGPALAVVAYESVTRRPFADLDLLVPPDRVTAAQALRGAEPAARRRPGTRRPARAGRSPPRGSPPPRARSGGAPAASRARASACRRR